jgi:DNA-binding beta-propeller fold protein YncE
MVGVISLGSAATAIADPATQTFAGSLPAGTVKTKAWSFNVTQVGPIKVTLSWTTTTANFDVFLVGPAGTDVAKATTAGTTQPETIDYTATATGTYKVRVRATTGSSAYTVKVDYQVVPAGGGSGKASYVKSIGFNGPAGLYAYGMGYDRTDNTLLVADYWNYRVWRYNTDGTLAQATPVSKPAPGGATGGITAPYDVQADPWDTAGLGTKASLWVADQGSSRIVQFDHNGKWLQTIGQGGGGLDAAHPGANYPFGCGAGKMEIPTHIVVSDQPGHLIYVSDPRCRNVYIFNHAGQFQGQLDWTGSGVGTPVPRGVAEDAAGHIIVAEFNSRKLWFFDPSTKKIIGSTAAQSDMNDVRGIDVDQTNHFVYTVGAFWNRVYQFQYDAAISSSGGPGTIVGRFVNEWRNVDGTNYASGHQAFDSIRFPAVDSAGNVYVGETWGCDGPPTCSTAYGYGVEKYTPNSLAGKTCNIAPGQAQATCAGATRQPWATGPQPPPRGGFNQQNGIGIDPLTNNLYVVDTFEQRVQQFKTGPVTDPAFDCTGAGNCPAWIRQWGSRDPASPGSEGFGYPRALTFADGKVWVGDNNNAIVTFDPSGNFIHRYGSQGAAPGQFRGGVQGVRVEGGKVYATDIANCRLQVFDEASLLSTASGLAPLENLGTCGTGANQMSAPRGIAVDTANGVVYVAETGNSRISKWNLATNTATAIKPSCGGKGLSQPWGLTWDPSKTWIYIGDVKNARIVRWNPATNACDVVVTQADMPAGKTFMGSNFIEFDNTGQMYASDNSRTVYVFKITA